MVGCGDWLLSKPIMIISKGRKTSPTRGGTFSRKNQLCCRLATCERGGKSRLPRSVRKRLMPADFQPGNQDQIERQRRISQGGGAKLSVLSGLSMPLSFLE